MVPTAIPCPGRSRRRPGEHLPPNETTSQVLPLSRHQPRVPPDAKDRLTEPPVPGIDPSQPAPPSIAQRSPLRPRRVPVPSRTLAQPGTPTGRGSGSPRRFTEFSRSHFRPRCAAPHYDASKRAPHVSSSVPARSTRQHASVPTPRSPGTAGSSAVGLSPLRPGALGSQTPTRRCAEAATGSGSVGSHRSGSGARRHRRRHRARHRRTTTTTSHPSAQHRAPRWNDSGGRSARTTPLHAVRTRPNLPGTGHGGKPPFDLPAGPSFGQSRAARDRPERGDRPPEAGWHAQLTPWLDAELVGQRVATARLRPDGTLNSPLAHHHEPGPASPRDPPAPFSACSFRTDDGPVPGTQSRDDHTVEDDDLTVDVGVQLGDRCRRPRRQTSSNGARYRSQPKSVAAAPRQTAEPNL